MLPLDKIETLVVIIVPLKVFDGFTRRQWRYQVLGISICASFRTSCSNNWSLHGLNHNIKSIMHRIVGTAYTCAIFLHKITNYPYASIIYRYLWFWYSRSSPHGTSYLFIDVEFNLDVFMVLVRSLAIFLPSKLPYTRVRISIPFILVGTIFSFTLRK